MIVDGARTTFSNLVVSPKQLLMYRPNSELKSDK